MNTIVMRLPMIKWVKNFFSKILEKLIVRIIKENIALKNEVKYLREQVTFDVLTGLTKKEVLYKDLSNFVTTILSGPANKRKGHKTLVASLLFIDIDNFKHINDTYGHRVGDHVLQKVALILKQNVRNNDVVARWGGEEIVIFLPRADSEIAIKKAEAIRKAISSDTVLGEEKSITVSIGVSEYPRGTSVDSWVELADAAMYQAKKAGKNRVEVAS